MIATTKTALAATLALALASCTASAALASETIAYAYDAKGRLVQTVSSGTVNNGHSSTTVFDAADNRINYRVSLSGVTPPPPPPPPPPPAPSNQPPVANADYAGSMAMCAFKSVNVTANDTDPDGNYPLSLISATGIGVDAYVESASTIGIESNTSRGTKTVTYVVADSLGATAIGTVTISVAGSAGAQGCTLQ